MKNYLCRPQRRDRHTKILAFSLLLLAFVSFFLSSYLKELKALGQLMAAIFLVIFIQITTRYLLTDYRYALEDGQLLLSSRQGKREKNLGGIPVNEKSILLDRDAWRRDKKKYRLSARFSYCQNLFPQKAVYLLTQEEKGYVLLIFEPDEALLSLLHEQIKSL